jgi:hypothetical protein
MHTKPNAAAVKICRTYWNPERTRCQGCPLATPCTAPCQPLTAESFERHTATLNAAATEIERAAS